MIDETKLNLKYAPMDSAAYLPWLRRRAKNLLAYVSNATTTFNETQTTWDWLRLLPEPLANVNFEVKVAGDGSLMVCDVVHRGEQIPLTRLSTEDLFWLIVYLYDIDTAVCNLATWKKLRRKK